MADKPPVSTRRTRAVTAEKWGIPDRNEAGDPICRWCGRGVTPPRRTFCCEPCVHEWKIRSSAWYVRQQVKKRDKGICRLCGFNVIKAHRAWTSGKPPAGDRAARRRWRAAKPRWEADHIVAVADGGGECGLENYRLLCRECHLRITLAWRAQRAARAKTGRHPEGTDGAEGTEPTEVNRSNGGNGGRTESHG